MNNNSSINITKLFSFILITLIISAGIYLIGFRNDSKREVANVEVKEKTDTVFVNKFTSVVKYKPVHDTIRIVDTVSVKDFIIIISAEVAKLDTLIIDEPDSTHLRVWYFNRPLDYFDFKIWYNRPVLTNTIEKTVYLEKPKHWLDDIGIGIGAGIDQRGNTGINFSIYYNLLPRR
jgi:hypothetical protein